MLDLAYLARYRVLQSALWKAAVAGGFLRYEDLTGTRLALHGFRAPARPVLFATKPSQKCAQGKQTAEPVRRIGSRLGARSLWAGFDDERCAAALHAGADRGARTTDGCRPVVGRRSLEG